MKMRIVMTCFVCLLLAVGCFSNSQPPSNNPGKLPTAVSQTALVGSPTEENERRYTLTPLPIPTLSITQQTNLMLLLHSDSCNLPCFLGIEPGKTTFDEAEKIITDLGGTLRADYENFYEGFPEKSPLRLSTYIFDVESLFYIDANISKKDNQVQQIAVDIFGNFQPLFYKAWSKYSMESIFRSYAEPDQILIYVGDRSYELRVVYLNYGMILDWTGVRNENSPGYKICPKFSIDNVVGLLIAIADTKSTFEIVPSSYMGYDEMWKSTNETLGISEKEFYERIVLDSTACFDVIGIK
jgi:hypothetical protein